MPIDRRHCRAIFAHLNRELTGITKHSAPEATHKFRTTVRRVETVVETLTPKADRGTRKLTKTLRRLRKKAGKVRDLDVQLASLKNLKAARENGQKAQLMRTLSAERAKKEKKLVGALDAESVRELRKRLKRACGQLEFPAGVEPVTLALQGLAAISEDRSPLTQRKVHQYRIAGKRARYIIEMAGKSPAANEVSADLKRMQDVIGDWHDWLNLTERAEALFGGVRDSALVAAMRNLTRAKFRDSVDAIIRMRQSFAGADKVRKGKAPHKESGRTIASIPTAA